MKTVYFVDFDNTISMDDVWDSMVKRWAPDIWEEVVRKYIAGEITSRMYNEEIAAIITIKKDEAQDHVLRMKIDPTFHDFVHWVESHSNELLVVSDGYDFYINLLFRHEGLHHIPVFSNKMVWKEEGIQVQFPLYIENCDKDMAHCKCQHQKRFKNHRKVYIGDGVSDICAAEKCDKIYAKRDLLSHCKKNNIPHTSFLTFTDIIKHERATQTS